MKMKIKTNILFLCFFFSFFNIYAFSSIELRVPLNHNNLSEGYSFIQYQIVSDFDPSKETILIYSDPIDDYFPEVDWSEILRGKFNVVKIIGRHNFDSFFKNVSKAGEINWSRSYMIFNQYQIAMDIETVRATLLKENKVSFITGSSSATAIFQYLSMFPEKVKSVICINPLLFDLQKNLSFKKFEIDDPLFYKNTSPESLFKFGYYANFIEKNINTEEKNNFYHQSLFTFNSYSYLFFNKQITNERSRSLALKVRFFEHTYNLQENKTMPEEGKNSLYSWMYIESRPLWLSHSQIPFSVVGVFYDKGEIYSGKILIIGSAQNWLIHPKSFEALAEFYPTSTLFMVNDGHAMLAVKEGSLLQNFVFAYLLDDRKMKISSFTAFRKEGLIFQNQYSSEKIPER